MPTIKRIGPYRFFFVSIDSGEPPHVHIQRDNIIAKFWLEPVSLAKGGGFKAHELNQLARLVEAHRKEFLEKWNEFFGRR
ncbi:MAG: DUF4160 domain-containing protein [Chloroflexi bacterium]|nr:MAG: DUF4160 domain-containing protein [Chloroflexota bacterium]